MASIVAAGAASPAHAGTVTDRAVAPGRRVLAVWAILSIILILINRDMIAALRFGDPDDALRLLQVRDLIAGQSWFDVHQYRIAAPQGVAMHWSRLVDIPLAGTLLLLRPFLSAALAETVMLVAVPLLTLLCALALVGRLAARFFNDEVVALSCLTVGIATPVLFQFTPMRIDHHGWQIVLALAALNGLAARSPWRGGVAIGLSLAALLAISIEGLPLTVLFLGICALRGLRRPDTRFDWLCAATASLAVGAIAIFLGTRGTGDLVTHCDAVSPVHLALFAWTALGAAALRRAAPRALGTQIAGLGLVGAGAGAILLTAAPQCGGGAFVMLDPLVRRYWYASVAEGLPAWHAAPAVAAAIIAIPLVGLYATFRLWRDARDAATRELWLDHLLLLGGAWLVGVMVARASATACVFAAVPSAALIMGWIYTLRTAALPRQLAGYAAIAVLLVPALPVVIASNFSPAMANASAGAVHRSQCRYAAAGKALDRLPATDIFAPLDIGPDLIVRSHHRVVATGHHRGVAGMHDVIAAFLSSPEQAHAIVLARHATLVAICPDVNEPGVYARHAPQGLMARLLANRPPAWLEPVDLAPGSGLRFWRVR